MTHPHDEATDLKAKATERDVNRALNRMSFTPFPFADWRVRDANARKPTSESAPSRCHLCTRPVNAKHNFVAMGSPIRRSEVGHITEGDSGVYATAQSLPSVGAVRLVSIGPECRKSMPTSTVFTLSQARTLLTQNNVTEY